MTMMWTIILVWLALQLPLGVLIGKSIKFGTVGHEKRRALRRKTRGSTLVSSGASRLHRLCVPLLVQKVAQRLLLFPCRNFSVRPREYQRRLAIILRWAAFSVGTRLGLFSLNHVGREQHTIAVGRGRQGFLERLPAALLVIQPS